MAPREILNRSAQRILMAMVDNDYRLICGHSIALNRYVFVSKQGARIELSPEQARWAARAKGLYKCKDEIKNRSISLAWYEKLYRINDLGREAVEEHRAAILAEDKATAETNAKSNRLVIIRVSGNRWASNPIFGYTRQIAGLFEVHKETKSRLYGRLVKSVDLGPYTMELYGITHGRDSETYIERDQIIIDQASEELFDKISKIDIEKFKDLKRKHTQLELERTELELRFAERAKQTRAMYADMMTEAGLPPEVAEKLNQIDSDHFDDYKSHREEKLRRTKDDLEDT